MRESRSSGADFHVSDGILIKRTADRGSSRRTPRGSQEFRSRVRTLRPAAKPRNPRCSPTGEPFSSADLDHAGRAVLPAARRQRVLRDAGSPSRAGGTASPRVRLGNWNWTGGVCAKRRVHPTEERSQDASRNHLRERLRGSGPLEGIGQLETGDGRFRPRSDPAQSDGVGRAGRSRRRRSPACWMPWPTSRSECGSSSCRAKSASCADEKLAEPEAGVRRPLWPGSRV